MDAIHVVLVDDSEEFLMGASSWISQETLDVTFPDGLNQHLAHADMLGICQNGQ